MFNIPILSIPIPQAKTGTLTPNGYVISGLKIPEPASSIQPRSGCFANNSAEGSVKGKYAGFIFICSDRLPACRGKWGVFSRETNSKDSKCADGAFYKRSKWSTGKYERARKTAR